MYTIISTNIYYITEKVMNHLSQHVFFQLRGFQILLRVQILNPPDIFIVHSPPRMSTSSTHFVCELDRRIFYI